MLLIRVDSKETLDRIFPGCTFGSRERGILGLIRGVIDVGPEGGSRSSGRRPGLLGESLRPGILGFRGGGMAMSTMYVPPNVLGWRILASFWVWRSRTPLGVAIHECCWNDKGPVPHLASERAS